MFKQKHRRPGRSGCRLQSWAPVAEAACFVAAAVVSFAAAASKNESLVCLLRLMLFPIPRCIPQVMQRNPVDVQMVACSHGRHDVSVQRIHWGREVAGSATEDKQLKQL